MQEHWQSLHLKMTGTLPGQFPDEINEKLGAEKNIYWDWGLAKAVDGIKEEQMPWHIT